MAHPSRTSSLRPDQPPPMYQFTGNPKSQQTGQPYNEAPPRIVFESVSDGSDGDYDEKTGFSTPTSDTEKPLSYSYPQHSKLNHNTPQNPLIQYIKDDWTSLRSTKGTGEEDDDFCPEGWMEILCSRAFKRWLVLWAILTTIFWIWWFKYFEPQHASSVASSFLTDSLKGRFLDESEYGYFGTNKRVEFAGMQHLTSLDRSLVPGSETAGAHGRRLIIIGDVHGCAEELEVLLKEVAFDASTDHLVSTGDMISKGPSSDQVLNTMMKHKASCVRGNNEDRVLHAYRDHHGASHQKVFTDQSAPLGEEAITLKHGHHKDLSLAASLTAEQMSYIAACPVILNLGPIPSMGSNVTVVHAGLVPGVSLEKQDPTAVMTMRSIDLRNQVPSPRYAPDPAQGPPPRPRNRYKKPDFSEWDEKNRLAILPWGDVWDTFQDMVPNLIKEGIKREQNPPSTSASTAAATATATVLPTPSQSPPTKPLNPYKHLSQSSVIYGHHSRAGVVEGRWHTGLDGGCFRGGTLAAMVIEETSFVKTMAGNKVKKSIVQVKCRDHWAEEKAKRQNR